jgi:L-threonylcarbamoyladenylate synthase
VRTRIVTVDPDEGPWEAVADLARLLDDGGIVAIPTETVYGLAVNLRDEAAVRRLSQVRGRAAEGQPTIHLADPADLEREVRNPPLAARKLATRFWPGPLTLVVSDRHGRPTGYRVPDVPVTRSLLRATEARIGVVGAAPAGGRPSVDADEVAAHFAGVIDAILDAGPARHGAPSSIVRVFPGGDVEMLHEGVVPADDVREATARTILFVCSGNRCRSPLAAAMATRMLARRAGVDELELLRRRRPRTPAPTAGSTSPRTAPSRSRMPCWSARTRSSS